uniref:Uncharacterized protein n=1 Tax=Neovison vison TaxID=452646 RepID=A0A8C7AAC3_NEOVI
FPSLTEQLLSAAQMGFSLCWSGAQICEEIEPTRAATCLSTFPKREAGQERLTCRPLTGLSRCVQCVSFFPRSCTHLNPPRNETKVGSTLATLGVAREGANLTCTQFLAQVIAVSNVYSGRLSILSKNHRDPDLRICFNSFPALILRGTSEIHRGYTSLLNLANQMNEEVVLLGAPLSLQVLNRNPALSSGNIWLKGPLCQSCKEPSLVDGIFTRPAQGRRRRRPAGWGIPSSQNRTPPTPAQLVPIPVTGREAYFIYLFDRERYKLPARQPSGLINKGSSQTKRVQETTQPPLGTVRAMERAAWFLSASRPGKCPFSPLPSGQAPAGHADSADMKEGRPAKQKSPAGDSGSALGQGRWKGSHRSWGDVRPDHQDCAVPSVRETQASCSDCCFPPLGSPQGGGPGMEPRFGVSGTRDPPPPPPPPRNMGFAEDSSPLSPYLVSQRYSLEEHKDDLPRDQQKTIYPQEIHVQRRAERPRFTPTSTLRQ